MIRYRSIGSGRTATDCSKKGGSTGGCLSYIPETGCRVNTVLVHHIVRRKVIYIYTALFYLGFIMYIIIILFITSIIPINSRGNKHHIIIIRMASFLNISSTALCHAFQTLKPITRKSSYKIKATTIWPKIKSRIGIFRTPATILHCSIFTRLIPTPLRFDT